MERYLIVCPFLFLSGLVDSIAGGGGLISFPAFVFAGVPMHVILGTSKLGAFPGAIVAALRFAKSGYVRWKTAIPCGVIAFLGAAFGATIALRLNERFIQSMMFVVLPVVAFNVMRNRDMVSDDRMSDLSEKKLLVYSLLIALFIGMYDGFYGPGTGTFLLLAFTGLAKLNTKEAAGITKIVNLSADVGALCTFSANGKVDVGLGIAAAVFCMIGSYIGSGLVVNNGQKIVRPVVLVVLVLLFAKLLMGA